MKHYITLLVTVFMLYTNAFGDISKPFYSIEVKTTGPDAIVNAIKEYSDVTKADEDSWKYSWVPGLAAFSRWRVRSKIEEYLKVCRGIFKHNAGETFKRWKNAYSLNLAPLCNALDNLDQQGEIALALLGQIKVNRTAEYSLYKELENFIEINQKLKVHFNCFAVKRQQESNEKKELKKAKVQLKTNKLWWETWALRWGIAKSVGSTAFQGAKWLAQTINENSVPLFSAAAAWYFYDKLFGTRRPAK